MKTDLKQYNVYWSRIEEDPNATHRQMGFRPVIVIQSNKLTESNILTTIVIPLTTKDRADGEFECDIKYTKMPRKSVALCDNVQMIDFYKIKTSDYITTLDSRDINNIEHCLKNVFGML